MNKSHAGAAWLAWRHLRRGQGRGDAAVLLMALAVAVAAIAAVTLLTARVHTALVREGASTLAADLKLELAAPLGAGRAQTLAATGVRTAAVTTFASALPHGDNVTLVSVKAVERAYPLRGALTLRRGPPGSARVRVDHGPPKGQMWVAQRVLDALGRTVGDTLALGDARLTIDAVLVSEPDRGPAFTDIAPRVMMAAADLAATGLLGPGSRTHHALLIAGTPAQRAAAREALEPTLGPGERLQRPAEANRALARALERADVFLDLAALVAVVLAGVAIALTAHRHAQARRDEIALLKALGARRGFISRLLAWQLGILGALGIGAGLVLGWAAQAGIGVFVGRAFAVDLPHAAIASVWPAPVAGALLLAGFAWPALAGACKAPPARVLSRALDAHRGRQLGVAAAAIASVAVLAAAATRDLVLTGYVLAAASLGAAALAGAAYLMIGIAAQARRRLGRRLGPGIRLGLAALTRRRGLGVLQIVAFGIGVAMLFALVIVRGDLLAGWRADIAANAPNRFIIDIGPDQRTPIANALHDAGLDTPTFYPLVRGRLISVAGRALDAHPQLERAAGELARRALNLSWTARLKADNQVTAGHWFRADDHGRDKASIATSVAERLDVGIGDTLGFDIAGQTRRLTVTSIRDIDWSSLQANFYVLLPPGTLDATTARYITSVYLAPGRHAVLADLVRRFPNLSVIDIDAILNQLTTLVDRVSLAVELVFGFTLAAGLVVLLAAAQAARAERRREAALLRALGARAATLRGAVVTECLVIGGCAALLAAAVARIGAQLLATRVLDLDYAARPGLWLAAIITATLLIAAAGTLSLGNVLRGSSWQRLREGG